MKKIGEIKGVPVVEGNINEVTKNQIHYKEDSGSIQLSKRGNDNKLNSVTGSGGSSNGNLENIDIKCYEYIRIDGTDLITFTLNQDFLNMIVEQKIPLPNVLCAYGGQETSRGTWKVLVDMPMDKAFVRYNYGNFDFEYGPAGDATKCFGYIFNNMATSTSEGVINDPFLDNNFKRLIDKDIIDTLGINLCMLIAFMLLTQDQNAEGNINEVLRETIKTMEFKEIPLTEYYTTQYQKAKEYYDSLEPIN